MRRRWRISPRGKTSHRGKKSCIFVRAQPSATTSCLCLRLRSPTGCIDCWCRVLAGQGVMAHTCRGVEVIFICFACQDDEHPTASSVPHSRFALSSSEKTVKEASNRSPSGRVGQLLQRRLAPRVMGLLVHRPALGIGDICRYHLQQYIERKNTILLHCACGQHNVSLQTIIVLPEEIIRY